MLAQTNTDPKSTPTTQDDAPSGSPTDEQDLLDEIKENLKEAADAQAEWRKEARECFGFRDGKEQWSEEDIEILDEDDRPIVTFNRIAPIVDVVTGMELQNRQEVRFVPRRVDGAGLGDTLTSAGKWVRDNCDAEEEESEAFRDMVTCGMGWTETSLDYLENPDGMIMIERISPLEMRWDTSAKKKNLSDSNWQARVRDVSEDFVMDQWPDKAEEVEIMGEISSPDTISVTSGPEPGDDWATPDNPDPKPEVGMLRLVEYQYRKLEVFYRAKDPQSGKVVSLDPTQMAKVRKRAQEIGLSIQFVKQKQYKYYRAYAVGSVLLENELCPDPASFTWKCMTGKRDENNFTWYGLVRGAIDPQRWANKWLSQGMHIFNTNAKGGVIVEKDAVDNINQFESTYSDPSAVTYVKPGGTQKITPKSPPPFPAQLNQLMEFAITSIRDVTGVSVELLGMADREQPLGLEMQRKQAGVTILAGFFDAIRKYRKDQGRLMLNLIQNYISDGRLIRVVGQGGAKYIPLLRDPEIVVYDVIVDDAPTSVNMKERTWAVLQQLLPILQPLGVPLTEEMLDYLPLPETLTMAWKQKMQPTPEQQMDKQIQMAGKKAAVDKINSEVHRNEADAQATKIEAQVKIAEAQAPSMPPDPKKTFDMLNAMAKADLAVTQNAQLGIVPGQSAHISLIPDPLTPGVDPHQQHGGQPSIAETQGQ